MSKHPSSDVLETNLPSTTEVTSALERTKEAIEEEASKKGFLSGERKIGMETAKVVGTVKEFIEEKNQGEIMQKMVKDANAAVHELMNMYQSVPFFQSRQQMITMKLQAKDYGKYAAQNLDALKNLGLTLINSSQFRGLLVDFMDIIEQTFKLETSGAPSLKPEKETVQPLTEEAKQKAEQVQQFGQQVIKDVKEGTLPIPEDKKQEIKFRFKNLLRTLASDPSYRNAVDGILALLDQVTFYGIQLKEQAVETVETKKPFFYNKDTAIYKFFIDLKTFLAGFSGQEALEKFFTDTYEFWQLVMKDDRLSSFFWDFRTFIVEGLSNPGLLDDENFNNKWNDLYERARLLLNDPLYNNQWNTLWFDLRLCIENIKNDTLQQRLATDASKLAKDLFLDTTGKPSLIVMANGLDNLRKLMLPILKKNLENVKIPMISGTNEKYDWVIEGLFLNAKEIIPSNVEMKVWGRANVSLTEAPSKVSTYLTMWIRNMHLDATDLKFYFNRKVIPKLEERGICNVHIKGHNELKITWRIEGEQDQPWVFAIEQVRCGIDNLDIYIKESTHTWLMKFITTLFSGSIKNSIEDNVEKNIKESLGGVNDKMNDTLKGIGM